MKKPTLLVVLVDTHDGFYHEVLVDQFGRTRGGRFQMSSLEEARKSCRDMRKYLQENGHKTTFYRKKSR